MIRLNRPACPHPEALNNKNYKHPTNKEALKESAYDKCMYCESKISHIDFAHVEHIKPKADDKFPDLEFVWENLGYACPKCNNAKSDKYDPAAPFLDPYNEDPSIELFAFGSFLFPRNGSERAELTIREIELNRGDLIEKRQTKIAEIQKVLNLCFRTKSQTLRNAALLEIRNEASAEKEYSFIVGALLAAHDVS